MSQPLTPYQAEAYDFAAGFRGQALQIAVAIEEAESGLFPGATNTAGNSAGTDRGIWQINSAYHPEVSNATAFNPAAASAAAYKIYQQSGNSFKQWSTYVSGAYQQFLAAAQRITQWFQYPTTQGFGVNGETGNDIGTPFHTPISALYGGTVLDAGYHPYGGQVEIATNVPGYGALTETFIHLDTIAAGIVPGAQVNAGEVLGLSGGENPGYPGGQHPAQPQYSTGPHIEIDFERGGKNLDPTAIIAAFRAGAPSASPSPPGGTQGSPVSSKPANDCSQYAIFSPQWWTCQAANAGAGAAPGINQLVGGVENWLASAGFVAAGALLIILGLLVLFFAHGGAKVVVRAAEGAAIA